MEYEVKNWIKHPGFYIKEELDARGWLQRDLAFILGMPEQGVNMIIGGKRGISPDMARAFGDAFDVPAEFFANLQQSYDLAQARKPDPSVAARRNMQSVYPVREMIKRGWIEDSDAAMLETQLVRFFGVENAQQIPYMNHAGKKTIYGDLSPEQLAWLRRVRQIASTTSAVKYNRNRLREAEKTLRGLLQAPEEARHVPRVLMECGVRFIVVEKLPKAKIDGVCFWLDKTSPVIGMSLQRDKIDNFWFVLRHEIEHVLQGHGQKTPVIDRDLGPISDDVSEEERVANEAAAEFCVPQDKLISFISRKHPYFYEKDVIAFSRLHQRHVGIVVGQMQRRLDRWDYLTRHQHKIRQFVTSGAIVDGWGQKLNIPI